MKTEVLEIMDKLPAVCPGRSRLYHLEPVRQANGLVESLTSYIARLAAAHCLPVWALVTRELTPLFQRKSITQPNGHCDLLGRFGASVNGNNGTAQESASIIERLTAQADLSDLTMLVARDRLASTPLMRPTQAWCPNCLDEWSEAQRSLYYPLPWSLVAIRACPVHRTPIIQCCRRCNRAHHPLARRLRIGYCPWCGSWLGRAAEESRTNGGRQPHATDWECYAAEATTNLLPNLATIKHRCSSQDSLFATNISNIVQHLFQGSMNALATFLHCDHGTIKDWIRRTRRPSLNSLLVLAYRIDVPPSNLLLELWDPGASSKLRPAVEGDNARLRASLRKIADGHIERTLRGAVDRNLWPPPSLRQVCVQAGFHQTQASHKFPELSGQITERHKSYRSDRRRRGEQLLRNTVRSAVNELHSAGVYPSYRRLRTKLHGVVFLRDPLAKAERDATIKELGLGVSTRSD